MTFFQVNIKILFLQRFQESIDNIDMILTQIFGLKQDVIKLEDEKNMKILGPNLVDDSLETNCGIPQPEKYYLIVEVNIIGSKSCLLLFSLLDPDLVIDIDLVEVCEILCTIKPVKRFVNQQQRIPVFYDQVIEVSVIDTQSQTTIRIFRK